MIRRIFKWVVLPAIGLGAVIAGLLYLVQDEDRDNREMLGSVRRSKKKGIDRPPTVIWVVQSDATASDEGGLLSEADQVEAKRISSYLYSQPPPAGALFILSSPRQDAQEIARMLGQDFLTEPQVKKWLGHSSHHSIGDLRRFMTDHLECHLFIVVTHAGLAEPIKGLGEAKEVPDHPTLTRVELASAV